MSVVSLELVLVVLSELELKLELKLELVYTLNKLDHFHIRLPTLPNIH